MAEIHPQLQKDCLVLGRFSLCHLLLTLDANYPWFILVPDRDNISEIFQLSREDQVQLMHESSALSEKLVQIFHADKLNVATLGNQVPQLHVHHIVRYQSDPAWPSPVWGKLPVVPYSAHAISELIAKLKRSGLSELNFV